MNWIADFAGIGGSVLIAVGVWQFSPSAACIVVGLILLVVSYAIADGDRK